MRFGSGRLAISIIMIVFSVIVLFQSMIALILTLNENADGSIGLLVFLSMIILGVIGIVTKNTKSVLCIKILGTISGLIGIYCICIYNGIFSDLKYCGYLFAFYSMIFIFSIKNK